MNITKSVPLPERPCEQLTCCALCVCDPKYKHGNDSHYQAGGQGYQPGGRFLVDFLRLGHFSKKSSSANLSGLEDKKGFVFSVLDNSASSRSMVFSCFCRMMSQSGEILSSSCSDAFSVIVLPCKAMRRSTSRHGADSDYSFDSIPRLSNSRRKSLFIHPERLSSPSSFMAMLKRSNKSASRRSCTENLSFLLSLVDIAYLRYNNYFEVTMYTNDTTKAKPAGAINTNGLLTTNDSNSIEVAMLNHTTHPQGRDSHNLNKAGVKNQLIATASQGYDSRAP
ncbi:host cell division inhibitor Icd-like protein, partial [Escherichia coli]|nr:host cell division inhibitor Icd-like protein [Escherichia coli]